MKRVLALQFDRDDPPGYLGEIMQEHGIECPAVYVEEEAIPDPTQYSALLAMGGPQHVWHHDRSPYLDDAVEAMRRAVESDVPVLGLCLGGQLLASAMGAEVRRHTSTHIGFYQVLLTDEGWQDPLFAGLPGYQQVFHWHEDTFDIPRGAVQLATNRATQNQAFRYGRRAYGTQYHIELTHAMIDAWLLGPPFHEEIVKWIGEEGAARAVEDGHRLYSLYREHTRTMFENFLRIAGLIA
jgi:GMP synthase-like glutamine amidotransferase